MGYYDDALTKFEVFNSVIRMSKPYKSVDAIYADPPVYDVYITGSDQLWNPTQRFCLEPFFLTFVPNNAVKISYASSIGISSLTNIEKNDFKKWLSSYNAISVREKQAQKMLNELLMGKMYSRFLILHFCWIETFGRIWRLFQIIENPIFYFSL